MGVEQAPVYKKLLRGSSFRENKNTRTPLGSYPHGKREITSSYKKSKKKKQEQIEMHNQLGFSSKTFANNSENKQNEPLTQFKEEVHFPNQSNEQNQMSYQMPIDSKQNVFYDNPSKSNSPVKIEKPKLLAKNTKQLSFSNIGSDHNLDLIKEKSKKSPKNIDNIKNKSRTIGKMESSKNSNTKKPMGRVTKNMNKNSRAKQGGTNHNSGKPLRKKASRVGKKRQNGEQIKMGNQKRRTKKMMYQKEDSVMNKSYKNAIKIPNYMQNAKKKQKIEAETRKQSGFKTSYRNEEEKQAQKYSSKQGRNGK